jgi:putative FmdB family regulatory protein
MPTYTYRCTKCGDEIEAVQSMSDPPLKRCKKCRGALRRTFHPVGIVLKGSGFHRNDYRSPSRKSGESADKKSESTSSEDSSDKGSGDKGAGDKKSESKPESKPEKKSDTKTSGSSKASKAN